MPFHSFVLLIASLDPWSPSLPTRFQFLPIRIPLASERHSLLSFCCFDIRQPRSLVSHLASRIFAFPFFSSSIRVSSLSTIDFLTAFTIVCHQLHQENSFACSFQPQKDLLRCTSCHRKPYYRIRTLPYDIPEHNFNSHHRLD